MPRRPTPIHTGLSMVPGLGDIALFPEQKRMNERERAREVLEVHSQNDRPYE